VLDGWLAVSIAKKTLPKVLIYNLGTLLS